MFAARAIAARGVVVMARPTPVLRVAKRNMSGGGAKYIPPPGSVEEKILNVLDKDWKVVCGVMGMYGSLYMVSKLFSGGKKSKQTATPEGSESAASASSGSSDIPAFESDEFWVWVEKEGNMDKWVKRVEEDLA